MPRKGGATDCPTLSGGIQENKVLFFLKGLINNYNWYIFKARVNNFYTNFSRSKNSIYKFIIGVFHEKLRPHRFPLFG